MDLSLQQIAAVQDSQKGRKRVWLWPSLAEPSACGATSGADQEATYLPHTPTCAKAQIADAKPNRHRIPAETAAASAMWQLYLSTVEIYRQQSAPALIRLVKHFISYQDLNLSHTLCTLLIHVFHSHRKPSRGRANKGESLSSRFSCKSPTNPCQK